MSYTLFFRKKSKWQEQLGVSSQPLRRTAEMWQG